MTNAIENMNGTLRRVTRNVKRWRDESMMRRWLALGIAEAQRGFRRVKATRRWPHSSSRFGRERGSGEREAVA